MTSPNPLVFDFARKMADPAFRQRVHACGWASGTVIYAAQDGETADAVKARMAPGRRLLVMPDPGQPFEMLLLMCEIDR